MGCNAWIYGPDCPCDFRGGARIRTWRRALTRGRQWRSERSHSQSSAAVERRRSRISGGWRRQQQTALHPTPTATSGTETATNEPRSEPRRCRTQPRTAPTTNQSGIDRIAKDATQTHTFCSLPGSKAITAVMRASGLPAEFIREPILDREGRAQGAISATIRRRLPSTRAGSLTRNGGINGQYQSQPSPSPEMCPRQGRLVPAPPTRQMHLVPALERKGQIQSLR